MSLTRTAIVEVRADHTAVLPPEIPAGPLTITYRVEEPRTDEPLRTGEEVLREMREQGQVYDPNDRSPRRTGAEILREWESQGLIGDWADRDDLPKTPEEFSGWRRKIWERGPF